MDSEDKFSLLDTYPWTESERKLNSFCKAQCKDSQSLQESLHNKLSSSTLRNFLYHLNKQQLQRHYIQRDKLERVKFDVNKKLENLEKLERQNDFCDDLFELMDELLHNLTGEISLKTTLNKLKFLRLAGLKVGKADKSLAKLKALRALAVTGNCLPALPSDCLPPNLQLLEMYASPQLQPASLLQNKLPHLLYLGLARCNLTQDSLKGLGSVPNLYHLDLAHNELVDLENVVDACLNLTNLSSLLLVGNPCSMVVSYAQFICDSLKSLIFLDGVILKNHFGEPPREGKYDFTATLQFSFFRIMNLPQPPNQKVNKKKVSHTFRIEVDSSLSKLCIPEYEEEFIKSNLPEDVKLSNKSDINNNKIKQSVQEYSKNTNSTKNKKLKGAIKNTKLGDQLKEENSKSTYLKVKEEEPEDKVKYNNTPLHQHIPNEGSTLKSERQSWSKTITFNDPTIDVNNCDPTDLRNLFRTNVTIRLVHIKTLPQSTMKSKSKTKKQNKLGDSVEYNKNNQDSNKDLLISKFNVAEIRVPLQDILWNKIYLEYAWNEREPFKVVLSSGLKGLQYVKKKAASKSKKSRVDKKEGEVDKSGVLEIPSSLTCHFGVGIKHNIC